MPGTGDHDRRNTHYGFLAQYLPWMERRPLGERALAVQPAVERNGRIYLLTRAYAVYAFAGLNEYFDRIGRRLQTGYDKGGHTGGIQHHRGTCTVPTWSPCGTDLWTESDGIRLENAGRVVEDQPRRQPATHGRLLEYPDDAAARGSFTPHRRSIRYEVLLDYPKTRKKGTPKENRWDDLARRGESLHSNRIDRRHRN